MSPGRRLAKGVKVLEDMTSIVTKLQKTKLDSVSEREDSKHAGFKQPAVTEYFSQSWFFTKNEK